jgi:hypothetical protein
MLTVAARLRPETEATFVGMRFWTGLAVIVAVVLAPPAAGVPTTEPLRASPATIVFGRSTVLHGQFANRIPDQPVAVRARQYGERSYTTVGEPSTGAQGRWRLTVSPTIGTTYEVRTENEVSAPLVVHVRPRVSLSRRSGRFVVRVTSTVSYEGRFLLIQRRVGGRWARAARVVVSRRPRRFGVPLPHGRSQIRAYLPRAQAGAGYVAGISPTIAVRR